jgi:hypothetical protein
MLTVSLGEFNGKMSKLSINSISTYMGYQCISKKNTIQWPKEKVPKNKHRSTKHTHKTKDRVTRIPLKTGGELRCSGRVSNSCSTSGTRRVNLVTNPMISHEWGNDREVLTTSGTYPWSCVTQIFYNGQPSHGGDRKMFVAMTSTSVKVKVGGRLVSISSILNFKLMA